MYEQCQPGDIVAVYAEDDRRKYWLAQVVRANLRVYSIRDSGVRFRSDGNVIPFAMYDSGHLQDRIDYKSFYGYIIVWMGAPILWTCKKHQHVGESSSEDEFMALNHAYYGVVWYAQSQSTSNAPSPRLVFPVVTKGIWYHMPFVSLGLGVATEI